MTYNEWITEHDKNLKNILVKLDGSSTDDIVNYFRYENMVINEPDFCPLYRAKTKCHNTDNLNCFYCGCPFFESSDDKPFEIRDSKKVMSRCVVNSRFAQDFIHEDIIQCDCSNCMIPHTDNIVKQHFNSLDNNIEDACSFLEQLRAYQLADILGKFKLF